VAFPGPVDVGVRVTRIGRSSVVFGFGLYVPDNQEIATHGEWVQVYIDRETRRPVPMPDVVRAHLEGAMARRPVLAEEPA
jgi:acyl-CoA thioester hydrolase